MRKKETFIYRIACIFRTASRMAQKTHGQPVGLKRPRTTRNVPTAEFRSEARHQEHCDHSTTLASGAELS